MGFKFVEYRPCLVDGERGLFHCFDTREEVVFKTVQGMIIKRDMFDKLIDQIKETGICPPGIDAVKISHTYALVEFKDGTMCEVDPTSVKFLDSEGKFNAYSFDAPEEPVEDDENVGGFCCGPDSCEIKFN